MSVGTDGSGSMVSNSEVQVYDKTHAAFTYAAPSLAVLYSSDEYRNVQGDNGAYYPSARIIRTEIQV